MSFFKRKPVNYVPIKEGNTVIFYINTGGFPLINDTWLQMFEYAKELQPNASNKLDILKNQRDLDDVSYPNVPYVHIYNKKISNSEKIQKIQDYINQLQYNHTGLQFFDIRKDRPLIGLMEVSKKMIEDSLPIKCLEAVILSIYLTNEIDSNPNSVNTLEKFTLGFKTSSKGNVHRHVVLGVYCRQSNLFGALGISRRSDLGYKSLKFLSLTELILDYINSYSNYLHKVKRIKIGMPIPNSNRSFESIPWNGCTINLSNSNVAEWSKYVEKHSRLMRHSNGSSLSNLPQTSFSIKNMNKSNNINGKQSYLAQHLEKSKNFSKKRSKSLEQNFSSNIENDETDDYDIDNEDIDYDEEENIKNENNLAEIASNYELKEQDLSFLPRTAPVSNLIRKNIESITSFRLDNLKSSNSSTILNKRKNKSLRV